MALTKQTARKSTGGLAPRKFAVLVSKRTKSSIPPRVRQMARKSSALPPPCSPNTSRRVQKVKHEAETLEPRFTRLSLRKTNAEQNRMEPTTSSGDNKGDIKKTEN